MGLMREKVATSWNHQHKQEAINVAFAHTPCPLPAIWRQSRVSTIQWKRNVQETNKGFDNWFNNMNKINNTQIKFTM